MKYKLLAVSTPDEVNIGDYIQALAPSQFLPSIDGYIQREELGLYNGELSKMIMNGWYMHHPENWPPTDKVDPLYVAFHMNSLAKDQLLRKESIDYFKSKEPIGCRDEKTRDALIENGVDAYFSGCMTLTLGYKYKDQNKENKCYFVDPYFRTNWNVFTILRAGFRLLSNWSDINTISKKYPSTNSGLKKKLSLTTFLHEYSKIFTRDILLDATYVNQQSTGIKAMFNSEEAYLEEAERLVKQYAKARLVVTSRIHCALPCLAIETPVIYTEDTNQTEASSCRLNGLRELFNIINWEDDKLVNQFKISGKISGNNFPKNKENWRPLAKQLIESCKNFLKS